MVTCGFTEDAYGACVGGRHADVVEGTRRSKDLFEVNVNHTYLVQATAINKTTSHLEYCPARTFSHHELSRKRFLEGPMPNRSSYRDIHTYATADQLECGNEVLPPNSYTVVVGEDRVEDVCLINCIPEDVSPQRLPQGVSENRVIVDVVLADHAVGVVSTMAVMLHLFLICHTSLSFVSFSLLDLSLAHF